MTVHFKLGVPRRKRSILAVLAVLAAVITGSAYAVWSFTGTSAATGQIGSLSNAITLSVPATFPTGGDLFPGAGPGALQVHINNTSGGVLHLMSVGAGTTRTTSNEATCPGATYLTMTAATLSPPVNIPTGNNDVTIPAANFPAGTGLQLAANAPSACQSATVQANGVQLTITN